MGILKRIARKLKHIFNKIFKIQKKSLTSEIQSLTSEIQSLTSEIRLLKSDLITIQNISIPAALTHGTVFNKYKNIHNDRYIVLLGAGPTLNKFTPIEDAIYIGTNRTFKYNKVILDYLFIQDLLVGDNDQELANEYGGINCKKFYGRHYLNTPISMTDRDKSKAESFYFIDQKVPCNTLVDFNPDISTRPLNTWSSIIFPALEFALWTNPKRIYIVGCDCTSNEHFDGTTFKLYVENVLYGWNHMKAFIQYHYPDTEVISINPVGLKGLFKDEYTEDNWDSSPPRMP